MSPGSLRGYEKMLRRLLGLSSNSESDKSKTIPNIYNVWVYGNSFTKGMDCLDPVSKTDWTTCAWPGRVCAWLQQ